MENQEEVAPEVAPEESTESKIAALKKRIEAIESKFNNPALAHLFI